MRIFDFRFSIFDCPNGAMSRGLMIMFVGLLPVGRLAAEGNSSLSESKVETAEHAVTAETLLAQNEELRRQLSIAQVSLRALTSSLAESNAEAELFRRKFSDLELRMEALGLASVSKDRAKLEQRLLAAVSDLQLAHKEREEFRDQMLRLNEAMLVTKSASAPDLPEPSLMDGSVISVKDEWSFVVGNLGEKEGVKIGMPMRVMRDDRKIATLRVVDVRQKICGAVIQEMDSEKEKIRVGDHLQVDAQSNVSLK